MNPKTITISIDGRRMTLPCEEFLAIMEKAKSVVDVASCEWYDRNGKKIAVSFAN